MRKTLLVLSLVLVLLAGCTPCDKEAYITSLEPIIEKWGDHVQVANYTSRINLGAEVSKLQEIKREANNLEIDACFEEAHQHLINSFDSEIEAFMAFMRESSDVVVSNYHELSQDELGRWTDCLEELE